MRYYRLLVYYLLIPFVLISQNKGQFIGVSQDANIPFTITSFNTKHGLPQNQVMSIIPNKNGNLLLSTSNGIVEFDGFNFEYLDTDNEYKNLAYSKLLFHEKSNTLFGQEFDGRLSQIYPTYKSYRNYVAAAIQNDLIYAMDLQGTLFVSPIHNLNFKKLFETGLKNPSRMFISSNYAYIKTFTGSFSLDLKTSELTKLAVEHVKYFKKNPYTNQIFGFGNSDIYKFNGKTSEKILDMRNISENTILEDIDFSEDKIFIATTKGLFIKTILQIEHYAVQDGFTSQFIQSIYYSKADDCLFLGTGEKGLMKLQYKNCRSLPINNDYGAPGSLSSIINTKNNGILALDLKGTIYKYAHDSLYQYNCIDGAGSSLAEIDENLYGGTWNNGLMIIKGKETMKHLNAPDELNNNSIHASFKDNKGNIWIGTHNGISKGTSIYNIKPFQSDKISEVIICFYELTDGTICVGGSKGAFLIDDNNEVIHLSKNEGLVGREVRAFYEDHEGKLWIGTYGGGLYCYHKNKLTSINKRRNNGLTDEIFCLAPDHLGYLYITSNNGLWRIKEKDLSDYYYDKKDYLVPFFYGEETGILNTEFNGGFQSNYLKTKQSTILFPTVEGLLVVKPERPDFQKLKPVINSVSINDTLYNDTTHVFERNTYSIKFDFYCQRLINKYNICYQYKLTDGVSSKWSSLQKEKEIIFKLLPPGTYTFSIRAIDGFNDPLPEETHYVFEIKPYFYETLSFKIITLLITLTLIAIFIKLRVNAHKKKIEQKERYKRQILELELNAIQAKLNPHFIFNCISAIKHYILQNDNIKANEGLNKLSKLIRSSVENSDELFVTLKRELTFITNYVDLEKMRWQNQLGYKINLEKDIDENMIIPHLLMQPYIENAIKHGIANLTDKTGLLLIDLKQTTTHLVCTITDNGIGRKAGKLLSLKDEFHESRGVDLSKEKSILLNEYYKYDCKINVTDLYNENGASNGTKVVIEIPKSFNQ